ncbi:single-stranded DNA-binding protein [Companilactobacillus baiquanensis]|uniref:Single-stranded DNA-binding protein n=1 Tax=Companilactobacillus baiquanensis TaxID=2486005 RepID=A0ABW1UW87_9LACO|nr:single-stranded DNA-binding protein [Companilactobacillus baiquanensis]
MINRVVLVGRLTKDAELRYTQSGTAVASFTLAVNRQFTNAEGEREADFINCVIWRKAAENFANFTHKGSLVGIDGRIQTRNYENQQGQKVYVTEIVVENFSLLESRSESEASNDISTKRPKTQMSGQNQGDISTKQQNNQMSGQNTRPISPNGQNNQMGDPFADNSKPIDISDSDLPF